MAEDLVLGPLLRHVDETSATVWAEVGHRGTVEVTLAPAADSGSETTGGRSYQAHTFTVHGHHFALVDVDGLDPGTSTAYRMAVDGRRVWPPAYSTFPPSRIRTLPRGRRFRLLFGSCRTSVPHDATHNRTHGVDVLRAYALGLPGTDESQWPDLMLLLGDQVYADETSEAMREFIAARRDIGQAPYHELKDFEEYAHLYRLAWADPANRWLLSTLPSAMIFDDHDIRDDWNTSRTWREQVNATPWWRDRIVGGLGSYWVYQHLGNLTPAERAEDPLWAEIRRVGRDGDAGDVLDAFADRADREPDHARWSFHRDLGNNRLVVLDSRCGRMLSEDDRRMIDDAEMGWFDGLATGGLDHLLIGTSLPFLLPTGLHHLEAWDEAVADGAWGPRAARFAERLRQKVDLEHWAAFGHSFRRVADTVCAVAGGARGDPPATVCFLSGDVHHSYLAEARLRRQRAAAGRPAASRVLQLVCSPIRNPLPRVIRAVAAVAANGLAWPVGRAIARTAGVPDPAFRWAVTDGPWFDNSLATLDLDGRRARVWWWRARLPGGDPTLVPLRSVTLA